MGLKFLKVVCVSMTTGMGLVNTVIAGINTTTVGLLIFGLHELHLLDQLFLTEVVVFEARMTIYSHHIHERRSLRRDEEQTRNIGSIYAVII